jgi:hypothetical protein
MERIRFLRSILPSARDRAADAKPSECRSTDRHLPDSGMRHMFALQPLEESAFGEFLCHCVRCKWTFQIAPERVSVVAINNVGEPIEGAEARKRIATLAEGPCPAFADFPGYEKACAASRHHPIRDNLHALLFLLGLDF